MGAFADRMRILFAAPDMLAALEGLIEHAQPINWHDDEDEDPEFVEAWRAAHRAIRRARGVQATNSEAT